MAEQTVTARVMTKDAVFLPVARTVATTATVAVATAATVAGASAVATAAADHNRTGSGNASKGILPRCCEGGHENKTVHGVKTSVVENIRCQSAEPTLTMVEWARKPVKGKLVKLDGLDGIRRPYDRTREVNVKTHNQSHETGAKLAKADEEFNRVS